MLSSDGVLDLSELLAFIAAREPIQIDLDITKCRLQLPESEIQEFAAATVRAFSSMYQYSKLDMIQFRLTSEKSSGPSAQGLSCASRASRQDRYKEQDAWPNGASDCVHQDFAKHHNQWGTATSPEVAAGVCSAEGCVRPDGHDGHCTRSDSSPMQGNNIKDYLWEENDESSTMTPQTGSNGSLEEAMETDSQWHARAMASLRKSQEAEEQTTQIKDQASSSWVCYNSGDGLWWHRESDNKWFMEKNPGKWTKYLDPGTGRPYWWHGETGEWFFVTS